MMLDSAFWASFVVDAAVDVTVIVSVDVRSNPHHGVNHLEKHSD